MQKGADREWREIILPRLPRSWVNHGGVLVHASPVVRRPLPRETVSETLETAPMVHGVGRIIYMNQSQSWDDYRPTSMLPTMIRPTPLQTSETEPQVSRSSASFI